MSSAEFFVKFAELSWTECRFSWPWHRVRCRANMLAFYLTAHIAWWSSWWLGHLSGAALKAMDTDCPRVVSEANDLNKIRGFSEVCPKPVVLVDEWKTGWFSKATSFMWENERPCETQQEGQHWGPDVRSRKNCARWVHHWCYKAQYAQLQEEAGQPWSARWPETCCPLPSPQVSPTDLNMLNPFESQLVKFVFHLK